MFAYFLNKLGYSFFTLFGVVTIVFILFNILPGDPARMMLDQNENSEQLALIKKKYGFDQPLLNQYLFYMNDLSPVSFHKNTSGHYTFYTPEKYGGTVLFASPSYKVVLKVPYLRESFQKNGRKVTDIIAHTLPSTVLLAVLSIAVAVLFGIALGIVSALYANSLFDRLIAFTSTLGMSIPSFFSAILFAWIFGYLLHQYTGLDMTGSMYEVDDFGEGIHLSLKNSILPALVLGIRPLGVVIQLMRNSLLEVLNQEYIRTAKAKGLSTYRIVTRHALKNALNPVVTAISGWFASMLAGAVFVEYIFGWNGLGKEIVDALNNLDLPVIMGSVIVIAATFVLITILVDLIYAYLDPRIKLR